MNDHKWFFDAIHPLSSTAFQKAFHDELPKGCWNTHSWPHSPRPLHNPHYSNQIGTCFIQSQAMPDITALRRDILTQYVYLPYFNESCCMWFRFFWLQLSAYAPRNHRTCPSQTAVPTCFAPRAWRRVLTEWTFLHSLILRINYVHCVTRPTDPLSRCPLFWIDAVIHRRMWSICYGSWTIMTTLRCYSSFIS